VGLSGQEETSDEKKKKKKRKRMKRKRKLCLSRISTMVGGLRWLSGRRSKTSFFVDTHTLTLLEKKKSGFYN